MGLKGSANEECLEKKKRRMLQVTKKHTIIIIAHIENYEIKVFSNTLKSLIFNGLKLKL